MPPISPLASILKMIPSVAGAPREASPAGTPAPGGPGTPPPGSPSAGVPDDIFRQVLNQRTSQSQGVDPQFVVTQLKQMMSGAAALLPKVAFRIPNVDKHLTRAYAALQAALKEAETGVQSQAAQQPIDLSAANVSPAMGTPPGVSM